MKALIMKPDSLSLVEMVNSLEALQSIVEGNIEFVPLKADDGAHGYANDEGLLNGSKPNVMATLFFREYGFTPATDILFGTVIVLGDGEDGDEADVPDWCVEAAQGLLPRVKAIYRAAGSFGAAVTRATNVMN